MLNIQECSNLLPGDEKLIEKISAVKELIELDSTINKWFLAVLTDRYLLSINKPQIYGTQYERLDNNVVVREELDSTKTTDAERIEYGVETLAEQRWKLKNLNRKKLTELMDEGKTIDEIVLFVKNEDVLTSQYDLRETWFNHFGYNLMNQGKEEDALKIIDNDFTIQTNKLIGKGTNN